MSVYFVYRSHYEGPAGKHVRAFAHDSVLGWFQDVWAEARDAPDVDEWARSRLGCDVYGFASLFRAANEEDLETPATDAVLGQYLSEYLYVEGEVFYRPHVLQVLTDDDEIELAYYVFDDHYLQDRPGRAAYLLHDDWRLPTKSDESSYETAIPTRPIVPHGLGAGATYLVFLAAYDSCSLTDLEEWSGPCRIEGVGVDELADYLSDNTTEESRPIELKLLRSQLLTSDAAGDRLGAALRRVAHLPVHRLAESEYSSRIGLGTPEQDRRVVDDIANAMRGVLDQDPSKSKVGASDHLLQLCLHIGNWFGKDVYHQWIIFDDLWAGANRDLAEGILQYSRRWDVLTED